MKEKFDIKDDELRVIGKSVAPNVPPKKRRWMGYFLLVPLACIMTFMYILFNRFKTDMPESSGVFEEIPSATTDFKDRLGKEPDSAAGGFTEKIDTTINDIPLSIYIPHNANAELCLGTPDINDKDIILCAQAADIRRDNKKIVGAFVLKGEPLAWGLSKKGYCAIIGSRITIGVADNSPLFEEATEKGGYFFRQYPLVDNGTLIENEPKNKSFRKAVCSRNGQIFIASSNTPESFHDFAQALVDLGTDNAVYLVGGEYAKGWYQNSAGEITDFSKARRDRYKFENYIVWKR